MIKTQIKYKRKKLTIDQKALKKVVAPMARQIASQVKDEVPKRTGALRFSIGTKVISRNGNSAAVIGVKSKYSRTVKGKEKIPNLYALKVGVKNILKEFINQDTGDNLREAARKMVNELLK